VSPSSASVANSGMTGWPTVKRDIAPLVAHNHGRCDHLILGQVVDRDLIGGLGKGRGAGPHTEKQNQARQGDSSSPIH
jgi:hypothetical protein